MNELVLLGAEILQPLHALALSEMRGDPHAQADETSFRLQTSSVRPFVRATDHRDHTKRGIVITCFAGS